MISVWHKKSYSAMKSGHFRTNTCFSENQCTPEIFRRTIEYCGRWYFTKERFTVYFFLKDNSLESPSQREHFFGISLRRLSKLRSLRPENQLRPPPNKRKPKRQSASPVPLLTMYKDWRLCKTEVALWIRFFFLISTRKKKFFLKRSFPHFLRRKIGERSLCDFVKQFCNYH